MSDAPPRSSTPLGLGFLAGIGLVVIGAVGLLLVYGGMKKSDSKFVRIDQPPRALTTVQPGYPEIARESSVEGTVVIQALVGKDGRVEDTRVAQSIPVFEDSAVAAVRKWTFEPAKANGKPVAVWVAVPVKFTLQ